MRGRHSFFVSILVLAIISTTALAYVLLDPPRRWFLEGFPKQVIVDDRGKPGVTDVDGGVLAALAAVTAWNPGGGAPILDIMVAVPDAVALGDGISHLVFDDPLKICKGLCLAATTRLDVPQRPTIR